MERGEHLAVSVVLTSLYARGAPFPRHIVRRRWGLVRDVLLIDNPGLYHAANCLRERGFWDEAAVLELPGALDWSIDVVESQRVLTVNQRAYPARWIEVLGSAAPPVVWILGRPCASGSVSVVGQRQIESDDLDFAQNLGSWIIESGRSVVSGGAIGADTAAALGALDTGAEGRLAVILPYGLSQVAPDPRVCLMSVCEPNAPFSVGQAMERNSLIYASSALTCVVRSGFRTGGTWRGATEAIRRQTSRVGVRPIPDDPAATALIQLGAVPIRDRFDFAHAVRESESWQQQPPLPGNRGHRLFGA